MPTKIYRCISKEYKDHLSYKDNITRMKIEIKGICAYTYEASFEGMIG